MTLILASQSASRSAMLKAAGVLHQAVPAHLDERAIEAELSSSMPETIALALAQAKAEAVSRQRPGDLVLGSDSLVVVGGRRFDKPASRDEAAAHLRLFSGKHMSLHSAAALARGGRCLWKQVDTATLAFRDLSDRFIAGYLDHEWPAVAGCVGVFRIEGLGIQLFEEIRGDHFTVLGMPLFLVLRALRELKAISA
ncbi:nucleoside triphosphate pyrophosphatase [Novosphingobium sp.]|uniref:Maf family protein n=1 Tax=Novosphingobium sp. TaxID=1874826 RepID=UPI0025D4E4B0|nr:nucleoside triphosphate pyrophosphatase [Novosphingobium sp.]